jgi:hypothetical protein
MVFGQGPKGSFDTIRTPSFPEVADLEDFPAAVEK